MTREHDPAIQYDGQGRLRHLLTLDGMPRKTMVGLLDGAQALCDGRRGTGTPGILADLFFEPSTRTRCSFEIAAGRLGWQVVNFTEANSSLVKGETLADTVRTLAAMGVTACAVRHTDPAAVWTVARSAPETMSVINAGGGSDDHPTQGLLDALTVRQRKGALEGLTISICGDIRHSRVARSDIHAFGALGAEGIRLVGPEELLPRETPAHCERYTDFEAGIRGADVIVMLRIQTERMTAASVPDAAAYHAHWGLTADRLASAKPDCLVLHPGPANPGVEITTEVLEGPRSAVLTQVRNGVQVRAHLLSELTRAA